MVQLFFINNKLGTYHIMAHIIYERGGTQNKTVAKGGGGGTGGGVGGGSTVYEGSVNYLGPLHFACCPLERIKSHLVWGRVN